ncbi:hypothetical protein QFZ28_005898 [Neobacillus niacini]|nr:hypothetical protein [Neobacillus niacini]
MMNPSLSHLSYLKILSLMDKINMCEGGIVSIEGCPF